MDSQALVAVRDPPPLKRGCILVSAKGVESASPRTLRKGLARLDIAPFLVLYAAVVLRAGYHATRFEWQAFTYSSYALGAVGVLQALTLLFGQWSVGMRAALTTARAVGVEAADVVLVVPSKFSGEAEIVPIDRRVVKEGVLEVEELSFEFRKQRFVYNPAGADGQGAFEKLKFPVKDTFETYAKSAGHGTDAKQLSAFDKYGLNKFDVPLPPFGTLLKEHMLAPFFVFQVFCVALWCLDSYWYYSLFTLFMLVTFECTVVTQRLRNLKELRALSTPKQSIAVYRCGKWETLPGEALLPGDVISIGRPSGGPAAEEKVVPADCLLLAGNCIVEEAVLTGESTPQWKVNISDAAPGDRLHISQDKQYMLFSGTKILQHTGDKAARIRTPDGGCLAIVVRTGFETAQGRLMRTILFSTERVTANNWETGLFIAFLLIFAVAAAWHVLSNGLADPTRDRFKLILNCVMIITSVIPPELPMELSMAVNTSLLALSKKKVFCTEPFRIPFAGKVEVCCFDKTGTLTSDHLLLEGIVGDPDALPEPSPATAITDGGKSSSKSGRAGGRKKGTAAAASGSTAAEADATAKAAALNGGLHGSPSKPDSFPVPLLDSHAYSNGGTVNAITSSDGTDPAGVTGDDIRTKIVAVAGGSPLVLDPARMSPAVTRVLAGCQSLVMVADDVIGDPLEKAALQVVGWSLQGDSVQSPDRRTKLTLLHRFHFNSTLKRMSAVVRVEADSDPLGPSIHVVAKGAPEVIRSLLAEVPPDFDALYKGYATQGARVIALASREVDRNKDAATLRSMGREEAESGLTFAGFAIFQCPLKAESEPALRALRDSSHQLVMITGDAPLTACYAAAAVHIVTRPVLVLSHRAEEVGHAHGVEQVAGRVRQDSEYQWISPDEATQLPFQREWGPLLQLASEWDLAVSGDALGYVEGLGLSHRLVPLCQVFARVSPEQKELVLQTLRTLGRITLMCGDGTNDVGGLKAAHVGVALLSATEAAEKMRVQREKEAAAARKGGSGVGGGSTAVVAVGGVGGFGKDVKATPKKLPPGAAMLEKARSNGQTVTPAMERMAKWMDDMQEEVGADGVPMLRPGDASMASPFTAKSTGVMPCTDIIKQGRCTLVTTVQMFKILGLLCLSTAYSLSVMYLNGVKLSDVQATLTGMMTAGMFLFISQSRPMEILSPVRPHPSIFAPYFFLSLLGQFTLHLGLLVYMYNQALAQMPAGERQGTDAEFKPNLVNSVCYIVEAVVQLSTFAVNYVGHPFNSSIRDNRGLFNCLRMTAVFLVVVTYNFIPGLQEAFGLIDIPGPLKTQLLVLSIAMVVIAFKWEHWLRVAFPAPVPPEKGYMMYEKERLAWLQQQGGGSISAISKKRQ